MIHRPATSFGCLACPSWVDVDLPQSDLTPLPGFGELRGGSFSVVLSAPYAPIESVVVHGSRYTAIGEIREAHADPLIAIDSHEGGHGLLNRSARKDLIRLAAMQGFRSICLMLSSDDVKLWLELARCNDTIERLLGNVEFIEEVFATFFGFKLTEPDSMVLQDTNQIPRLLMPRIANRLEDQFVKAHAADDRFGAEFMRLYDDLARLRVRRGMAATLHAYNYAVALTEVADIRDAAFGLSLTPMNDSTVLQRLQHAMEIIDLAPYPPEQLDAWSKEQWEAFLSRYTGDYHGLLAQHARLATIVHRITDENVRWWRKFPFNPALTVLLNSTENGMRFVVDAPDVPLAKPAAIVHEDAAVQRIARNHARKGWAARRRGRSLVHLVSEGATMMAGGMAFVPVREPKTNAVLPGAIVLRDAGFDAMTDDEFERQWLARAGNPGSSLRALTQLVFLEGIRQMVKARKGLRCPLRPALSLNAGNVRWPQEVRERGCCGQAEWLHRVWQCGRHAAKELGFSFKQWEPPVECMTR